MQEVILSFKIMYNLIPLGIPSLPILRKESTPLEEKFSKHTEYTHFKILKRQIDS